MNLDILTLVTNRIYQTESYHLALLKILVSLRGTEYEEYIRYLIPPDLNVQDSYYDDLDCVNDIMIMVLDKKRKNKPVQLGSVVNTIDLYVLKRLMDKNYIKISSECVYKTIRIGRLDILEFLYRNDKFIGNIDLLFCSAAKNPDPSVFQWICDRMKSRCLTSTHIYTAIFHGNLEVIKCMHENKIYIGNRFIEVSSKLGHDHLTNWLKQNVSNNTPFRLNQTESID